MQVSQVSECRRVKEGTRRRRTLLRSGHEHNFSGRFGIRTGRMVVTLVAVTDNSFRRLLFLSKEVGNAKAGSLAIAARAGNCRLAGGRLKYDWCLDLNFCTHFHQCGMFDLFLEM